MNAGGWVTMVVSLGFVWVATIWSLRRVLSKPDARPTAAARSPGDER